MTQQPDIRVALQREAVRVRSALDDFAELAAPRKNKKQSLVTNPLPAIRSDVDTRREINHPHQSDGGFFEDFDPDATNWSAESKSQTDSVDFSPGIGADFVEGFESESDIPQKTGQDTLTMPTASMNQDTPASGTPKPTESINDVLDGFEW